MTFPIFILELFKFNSKPDTIVLGAALASFSFAAISLPFRVQADNDKGFYPPVLMKILRHNICH